MTDPHKGLFAVHSAVLIFGITALFSKLIELTALEITTMRSIFAILAIAVIFFWQKKTLRLSNVRDYGIVILLGILLAVHWVTYFHAMQVSSIAVGVIALFTFPIITVFLEPLFKGKKPHICDVMSALVVLLGIYFLVPEFSMENQVTLGILWGIFSALCFALRNIIQGQYFKGYSAHHSLLYQIMVTLIVLLPFSYTVIPEVTTTQWGLLLLLGVFFTALPHTLLVYSLLKINAKTVSLIACIQVVYAALFAVLFLGEKLELTTFIGGAIVISVAMYESFSTGKK